MGRYLMSRYSQYSVIYLQPSRVFAGGGAGESGFLHKKRVPGGLLSAPFDSDLKLCAVRGAPFCTKSGFPRIPFKFTLQAVLETSPFLGEAGFSCDYPVID